MPSTATQTATMGPKTMTTTALLVALAHFVGSVGALMGSGAMMTMTTKIDDGARPPQVVVAV
jgi:hypothetical protein